MEVNSFHHQAASVLGHGLVATAFAPDGVVEGVELPAARFVLGVQWHPEAFWREGRFAPLFRALVRRRRGAEVDRALARAFSRRARSRPAFIFGFASRRTIAAPGSPSASWPRFSRALLRDGRARLGERRFRAPPRGSSSSA